MDTKLFQSDPEDDEDELNVGDYYHSCGKRFLIRMISDDRDAINQFCEDNPGVGVIDSKDDSRVIVADIEETP